MASRGRTAHLAESQDRRATAGACTSSNRPCPSCSNRNLVSKSPKACARRSLDLPDHLRLPILLCYFERMSYKSAAQKLGVTEGTIRGRLAKARELLKFGFQSGLDPRSTSSRRDSSSSLEHKLPMVLVDATTRAAVAFSIRLTHKRSIATSVVRLAEGAINMMFLTRIIRFACRSF